MNKNKGKGFAKTDKECLNRAYKYIEKQFQYGYFTDEDFAKVSLILKNEIKGTEEEVSIDVTYISNYIEHVKYGILQTLEMMRDKKIDRHYQSELLIKTISETLIFIELDSYCDTDKILYDTIKKEVIKDTDYYCELVDFFIECELGMGK